MSCQKLFNDVEIFLPLRNFGSSQNKYHKHKRTLVIMLIILAESRPTELKGLLQRIQSLSLFGESMG